jgi:3-mercaptopyruvate sulfurtransferase SseA
VIPNPVRRTLRAAASVVALLAGGACAASSGPAPFREISVDQVASRLGEPGFHVLDANGPETYAKGHVPGARQVQYRKFTEADLPADREATLVFYCAGPL